MQDRFRSSLFPAYFPASTTIRTNSARALASIFFNTLCHLSSTVRVLMSSCEAITLFNLPSTISCMTRCSSSVSVENRC